MEMIFYDIIDSQKITAISYETTTAKSIFPFPDLLLHNLRFIISYNDVLETMSNKRLKLTPCH